MLINLSEDQGILKDLATDDDFLESLMHRITVCQLPNLSPSDSALLYSV